MESLTIEELKKLIDDGAVLIKSKRPYENQDRDTALLCFFMFSLALLPLILMSYILVKDALNIKAWIFFMFFLVFEVWIFDQGLKDYKLHKEPEKIFWPYFMKRYLKLVLLGPMKVEGTQYIYHGFITKGLSFRRVSAFFEVYIRKEIHKKAIELNEKVYDAAFDKDGKRKFVSMDGVVEDADEDVILVARFLVSLYALYGKDINEIYMGG